MFNKIDIQKYIIKGLPLSSRNKKLSSPDVAI
ncbi:hypothetical protein N824_24325 [Pedobacter sp. V48]|nr:hypothetical protein N824_24325 [Pedobacter sp. V48]